MCSSHSNLKLSCSQLSCKYFFQITVIMGRVGRGWKARKKSWFKTSNTQWFTSPVCQRGTSETGSSSGGNIKAKLCKRLTKQEFERTFKLSKGVLTSVADGILDSRNQSSPGILLRPFKEELSQVEETLKSKNTNGEVSGYTDVHLPTCVDAVQDILNEHSGHNPECLGRLTTKNELTTKWGVTASIQLKCNSCQFVSATKKLYREVPKTGRGRKAAEPNRSLALGLCNTAVGATGAQRLLSSMNKTCPSTSAMQKQLNQVGDELKTLNEEDMARQRGLLKDTLELAGYPRDTPIPAECDRQYNISLHNSRRKTPFAPATESRDVLAENLTPQKKIIAFNYESKVCRLGQDARRRGHKVKCPGHTGCTATLKVTDHAGDEKAGGRKLAQMLLEGSNPITVDKITTDADGRMADGLTDEMKKHGVDTEAFLDTVHLNRSVVAAITRANIKPRLESSVKLNSKQIKQATNRLADSIARRAESEVSAARSRYSDEEEITGAVAKSIPALLKCFQGDHQLCTTDSLVCDGINPSYEYIPKFAQGNFRLTTTDTEKVSSVLNKRMGREALRKTRFRFNTQKAESTNQAFSMTNPKHCMSFSRNSANRSHSAIHMKNNYVGDSIMIKARACSVPLSPNSRCLLTLRQLNRRQEYWRRRSKSTTDRRRRVVLRRQRYEAYDSTRNQSCYFKNQLAPE